MYRKCVTERSVQHQKQVEQALLELMQRLPYEDITVTALCQSAGVTRRIFYHLFSNKADALHAMIDHTILRSESYLPGEREAVRFFRYWKDQQPLLDVLAENQMTGLLLERMIGIILDEDYDVRNWLRPYGPEAEREVLSFALCGIMGMTYNWYYSGFRKSPEEMAALLEQLMSRGII